MGDTDKKTPTPPAEGLLPIRTVSLLTGVNAITLRAWERRYGLVIPQRTPKGHRLYTQQDVERILKHAGKLERQPRCLKGQRKGKI